MNKTVQLAIHPKIKEHKFKKQRGHSQQSKYSSVRFFLRASKSNLCDVSTVIQHIGPYCGNTEFIKKKRNKQRKPKKKKNALALPRVTEVCIPFTSNISSFSIERKQYLIFWPDKK